MSPALQPEQLRRSFDPAGFDFETTADLTPDTRIIGQPRGVEAIKFGIGIQSPGYNIYVLGESGTGRTTAIQRFIEYQAASDPVPSDWVYVNNFLEPHKPIALRLPAGQGCDFRDTLAELIDRLKDDIARAFDNEAFRDAALEIRHDTEAKREALLTALQTKASQMGAALVTSPEGFRIVPAVNGQPMSAEQFAQRSEAEQAAWKETAHALEHALNETMHEARRIESDAQGAVEELIRRVASSVVDLALDEFKQGYTDHDGVSAYLEEVHQDILDNVHFFRTSVKETDEDREKPPEEWFRRYQVNVLVDHKRSQGAPVVVEYDPTVTRLLGRVEHEARQGGVRTDFTLIENGALHAANGGYLVIRIRSLLAEQGAWEALKRALVGGLVRPDDPATRGGAAVRTLDPQPIPLDLKVLLVGPPTLYYMLHTTDEEFRTVFKVMADFDQNVPRNPENEMEYAIFVTTRCQEEGLLPLERDAIGRVIEYGSRLAGSQHKLSTRFGNIADLVREAHYWAAEADQKVITIADIARAIEAREYRRNRLETRSRERLLEGKQLIAKTGAIVGQSNGISVLQVGEHSFGQPTRVTARTYVGKQGVVQIDREVELAGPIHNKGLMTLIGYLGGRYADDQPLSLSAQITFEQNYAGIEGDSASSTELYALLSSIAEIPIRQSIAVTGSVNQHGEIQPIGGVTEKVEGWFEICQASGLTGEQGVIIPAANTADLMLKIPVVEAVAQGQFHVWAVTSVDEGIALLTGQPADEIHAAVKERLRVLAETGARFGKDEDS